MNLQNRKTILELENVSFSYPGEPPVLRHVGLRVGEGERVCILGANGCGKSTLLKILTGLLPPTEGSFRAFGEPVTEKALNQDAFSKRFHRRIGFIFQDSDVQLFCSSVRDEIRFGLFQLGLERDEAERRFLDAVGMLEIEPLLDKPPFKLSGGEKKKVALASVLVMNPEVYILDEPTNSLDPRTQSFLLRLLDTLSAAGKTLITSTHNLPLAERISDRSILFTEDHAVAADSPTTDLLRQPELLRSTNLVDETYLV